MPWRSGSGEPQATVILDPGKFTARDLQKALSDRPFGPMQTTGEHTGSSRNRVQDLLHGTVADDRHEIAMAAGLCSQNAEPDIGIVELNCSTRLARTSRFDDGTSGPAGRSIMPPAKFGIILFNPIRPIVR